MITLSLCMIIKDEELVLDRCLKSIYDVVDEIIIVDTGSTDNSKNICKNYTENIFTKLFKGPVGFIEKAAKTAEKQAAKMREIEADTYEDIFNKMQ